VDGADIEGHKAIIQIFDHELDDCCDAPDLAEFYENWVKRKGSSSVTEGGPALDMIINRMGIVPQGSGPDKKMAPYGFVEPDPDLPDERENLVAPDGNSNGTCDSGEFCTPGFSCTFDPQNQTVTLKAYWSYSESWGSLGRLVDAMPIRLGVSNLGSPNMEVDVSGSHDQSASASYSTSAINYAGSGGNWLALVARPAVV